MKTDTNKECRPSFIINSVDCISGFKSVALLVKYVMLVSTFQSALQVIK